MCSVLSCPSDDATVLGCGRNSSYILVQWRPARLLRISSMNSAGHACSLGQAARYVAPCGKALPVNSGPDSVARRALSQWTLSYVCTCVGACHVGDMHAALCVCVCVKCQSFLQNSPYRNYDYDSPYRTHLCKYADLSTILLLARLRLHHECGHRAECEVRRGEGVTNEEIRRLQPTAHLCHALFDPPPACRCILLVNFHALAHQQAEQRVAERKPALR